MCGTPEVTFVDLVRDTIQVHGLSWAIRYYAKRLTPFELRFFIRAAYLGS